MKINNEILIDRIRRTLDERCLTQTRLGDYLGLSRSSMSQYLSGSSSFQISQIRDIAEFLQVSPYWLIGESNEKYEWHVYKVPKLEDNGLLDRKNVKYSNVKHDFYSTIDFNVGRIVAGDIVFFDRDTQYKDGDIVAVNDDDGVVIGILTILNNTYVVTGKERVVTRNKKYAKILGKATSFIGEV